jgi:hypothetical protein
LHKPVEDAGVKTLGHGTNGPGNLCGKGII